MITEPMIPKLKVQTWKSGLNSTKVVILNNGTLQTIAKIQMTPIRSRESTKSYHSLEWIKHQEISIQGSHNQTSSGDWHLTNKL